MCPSPDPIPSLQQFCLRILTSGDLATKLEPPPETLADPREPALDFPERPLRNPEIAMAPRSTPLPRPGALRDPAARARCLARFAHHELMAVELFAWALLRWPQMPRGLRRSLASTLVEEQTHCRLYLERLRDHGDALCDHPQADYFWRQTPAISRSPAGPKAFLAAMGLTFEQANLDFTLVYRDGFRAAGDEASARVCQRVHDEEIGHVRSASNWLCKLGGNGVRDLEAYQDAIAFPLSLARAKSHRFFATPRREAGLSEAFIEAVRRARSTQETRRVPSQRNTSP